MLELRPNCEFCDRDLPADSADACICSYECSFCRECVGNVLQNVCPYCGGGFTARPLRPGEAYRDGTGLMHHPASTRRVNTPYTREQIRDFTAMVKQATADTRAAPSE